MQTAGPFGFKPIWHPSGQIRAQVFQDGIASGYGTAIFSGMPVILNTNGTIVAGTAAADIVGIFAGVQFTPAGGGRPILLPNWVAGSTYDAGTCQVSVYTDPDIVYKVQTAATMAVTARGDQADVSNVSNGSTYTGTSQATLGSVVGAGVQGQFRILELFLEPGNAWGDPFVNLQVSIARHQYISNKVAV